VRQALIVEGGLALHKPREVAEIYAAQLMEFDFNVKITDDLDTFRDEPLMKATDLVVLNYHLGDLNWKLGWIEPEQVAGLLQAVRNGAGLAGAHAGLGDAFRNEVEFQYMVGGQWVAHPGDDGVTYDVDIADPGHEIMRGVDAFTVVTEKYFMHMDPGVHVLATTQFDDVRMPIAWTKTYHAGKVFYSSLGHTPEIISMPPVLKMMTQGFLWAAR
jgi:type 1 glutamine amidotransferase